MSTIVEVKDLVKRYKDLVAVDHLNLSIQEGEIYGLLGPNGSGKTTAINTILSLLRYDNGEVTIFGEKMTSTNYDIKKRIGLVMQNVGVYDELTVEENIDYFCGLYIDDKNTRKQYVNEAIEFVDLDKFRKFKPGELSGGLLRRLNLACGIAHKPELILLDEPTVAVDPQSRNHILEGVKNLAKQGSTVIYTTHYMEEVEMICDRITIMDRGKEVITGTTEEIKAMSKHSEIITAEVYNLGEDTLAEIEALSGVTSTTYNGKDLLVQYTNGNNHLVHLIDILEAAEVDILNITVQKPTLNDVFLEITGKELRDEA